MLVLDANETANYRFIGLIMLISAVAPFVFLSKHGRKAIGLTKPTKKFLLLYAFISGLISSVVMYIAGVSLYGRSFEN